MYLVGLVGNLLAVIENAVSNLLIASSAAFAVGDPDVMLAAAVACSDDLRFPVFLG